MKLKQLYFGNTDAKNELFDESEATKQRFIDNYYLPKNINVNEVLAGSKFLVTGLKGIGKTALLRYMSLIAERELGAETSFMLFKTEFSDEDRALMARAGRSLGVEDNYSEGDEFSDYEDVWEWLFHRHIATLLEDMPITGIQEDEDFEKYAACAKAANMGNESSGLKRLLPKLKKGNIEISTNPKLGLEFDWENEASSLIKFSSLAKQVNSLFKRCRPGKKQLYIFVDELELNQFNSKKFERDARLIRDLIIAAEKFNKTASGLGIRIKIIVSVRKEVFGAVGALGKEVNKIHMDFGMPITWHHAGGDVSDHPLLQMMTKKILVSLGEDANHKTILSKYFAQYINNDEVEKYILHQTWYRPRDIVNLMNKCIREFPDEESFSQKVFEGVRRSYSEDAWLEISEGLTAIYKAEGIAAIKRIFYSFQKFFTVNDLYKRVDSIRQLYPEVTSFLEKNDLRTLLKRLYEFGAIGNLIEIEGRKGYMRFSFRGDDEILMEHKLVIHQALRSTLSIFS